MPMSDADIIIADNNSSDDGGEPYHLSEAPTGLGGRLGGGA